ncbi:MAG TPA: hypothetical protein VMX54_07700 [Vicinamibacteria bacterium]|nr:hypothetical protein [Vicinamibacteria bacterium]
MRTRSAILLLCTAGAVGALVACGGSSPSQPQPPVTVPTTTTTTTTQPAGIVLPAGMTCSPTPPPLYGSMVKVWSQTNPGRWIIDTHPLVMNVDHYCALTGQGDNKYCATRIEGDLQRTACDYLAIGQATDTGRWGPTWSYNGQPCDPPGASTGSGCTNDPVNQFKVIAKSSGAFQACASPLARVDAADGSRCNTLNVKMD